MVIAAILLLLSFHCRSSFGGQPSLDPYADMLTDYLAKYSQSEGGHSLVPPHLSARSATTDQVDLSEDSDLFISVLNDYSAKLALRPVKKISTTVAPSNHTTMILQPSNRSTTIETIWPPSMKPECVNTSTTQSPATDHTQPTHKPKKVLGAESSCSIAGRWNSEAMGVNLEVESVMNGVISVEMKRSDQPAILQPEKWTIKGEAPLEPASPICIIGSNRDDRILAAFLGQCRSYEGRDFIVGTWLIGLGAKDISQVHNAVTILEDVMPRVGPA